MNKIEILRVADRIRQDKYRIFNKELAHYIGLKESIYISYLIDQDIFFNKNNIGSPFYKKQTYISFETTLSKDDLRKINNKFSKMKLLQIEKKGLPAKNYFIINYTVLNELLDKAMINYQNMIDENISKSTARKSQELEPENFRDINNKYINNKETISKDIDEVGTSSDLDNKNINNNNLENDNLENNNEQINNLENNNLKAKKIINNNNGYENKNDGEVLDNSNQVLQKPAPPSTPRKGLAPLIDIVRQRYNERTDTELISNLITYLKAHIGCRRLPSEEKWRKMLDELELYASINLPGTDGSKFIRARAIEIIQKAITGKNGAPFLQFDNIYNVQKTNFDNFNFNLNEVFKKGY